MRPDASVFSSHPPVTPSREIPVTRSEHYAEEIKACFSKKSLALRVNRV